MINKESSPTDQPPFDPNELKKLKFKITNKYSLYIERVAYYDYKKFMIVARHASGYLDSDIVNQLLRKIKVQLSQRTVDSIPTQRDDPKQYRKRDDQGSESILPNPQDVKAIVTLKFSINKPDKIKQPHAVDFKIDPSVLSLAKYNPINENTPQRYEFGDDKATRIDLNLYSEEGSITANLSPGCYTVSPQTIPQGSITYFGASEINGATFSIDISGDGIFWMWGSYYMA